MDSILRMGKNNFPQEHYRVSSGLLVGPDGGVLVISTFLQLGLGWYCGYLPLITAHGT